MLRITRQSDYGIVLMTLFARGDTDEDVGRVLSARDMAEDTNLPLPTVSKILKALTRSGILASTRGVKGGYAVTRGMNDISVADVIEAVEGPIAMTDCVEDTGRDCIIKDTCPCTDNWQRVNSAVRGALAAIPISKMNSGCRFDGDAIAAAGIEAAGLEINATPEETDGQNELA